MRASVVALLCLMLSIDMSMTPPQLRRRRARTAP